MCVHTSEQDHTQWPSLESSWASFMGHDNADKFLIYEKAGASVEGVAKQQAIEQHAETGYVLWLATKDGVPSESPEPSKIEEVQYLRDQGHSDKAIMTYYFGRQMHQWVRQDKELEPDWRSYAEDVVAKYSSLGCWDKRLTFENVLGWYKEEAGQEFSESDEQAMYNISDPAQNKVSADSGEHRDVALLLAIKKNVKEGKDVFVVYGSGHAVRLEPELNKYFRFGEEN